MSATDNTPPFAAMRDHHRRIEAMIADEECVGDLMLLGVALARWVDYHLPALAKGERLTWERLGRLVVKPSRSGSLEVKQILKRDIRRYDPITDAGSHFFQSRCGAPMIRRQGPCGGPSTRQVLVSDPDTGRKSWLSGCTRHADWFTAQRIKSREVEPARMPFANAGGVLARHFPDIDWPDLYRKLDPQWAPPPEGEYEDDDLLIDRPKLRLILGGAS